MRGLVKKYLEEMSTQADFITYFSSCNKPSVHGNFGLIDAMDQVTLTLTLTLTQNLTLTHTQTPTQTRT